jgi:hypothetical protein
MQTRFFLSWNRPFLSELNSEFKTGSDMAISSKRADLDSTIAVIERSQILEWIVSQRQGA